MRSHFGFLAVALLVLAPSARAADAVLATGPMTGLEADVTVYCRIVNLNAKPITVTFAGFAINGGGVLQPDTNFCTAPVAPDGNCAFNISLGTPVAAGVIHVKGPVKNVRGRCYMTKGGVVFDTADMR